MAARDYDTDVDDPLAIDVVQGTNENENELEVAKSHVKWKPARILLFRLNYREAYVIKSDYTLDNNNVTEVRLMKSITGST